MTAPSAGGGSFVAFYRRYTRTWLHAVATAALTAFGALAVLHRGFVVVAIAAYVLPPIVLYVTGRVPAGGQVPDTSATTPEPSRERSEVTPPERREQSTASPEGPGDRSAATRAEQSEGTTRTGSNPATDGHWKRVDSPTGVELHDVAIAGGAGYAVGADGVVLGDADEGWRTVLAAGPGAAAATLRGVDATDDGGGVWIAGDGGTVARVDAATNRHVDFTAPAGRTDNWTDVATAGPSDDEVVLLCNGSGEVLRGRYRGGDLAWDEPVKPGSGSSLSGVVLAAASTGYCCDTNDGVFETTDGGESFQRIGLDGADGTLTDVAAIGPGDCTVSADDGVVHRHDDGTWTPIRVGDDALDAIALRNEQGVACGGRAVFERLEADDDWQRSVTSAPGPLAGVAIDPDRALAVGSDGAILERR